LEEFDMTLDWVGFELHPETPRGGMSISELFSADRVAAMRGDLRDAAARMGVEIGEPDHLPNSRRALALAEQARDAGTLQAARDAAMDAHWVHGRDIEDDAVLADIARIAGLDPAVAVPAADLPEWGVSGIPTFFFLPDGWTLETAPTWTGPSPLRLVGSKPLPGLREAARRVGALPR
jgi:predicted DsbA family dithiol-disulfide isomerase